MTDQEPKEPTPITAKRKRGRPKKITPAQLGVAQAALLTGETLRTAMDIAQLSMGTVERLRQKIYGAEKSHDYDQLVGQYTAAGLHVLTEQAIASAVPEWIYQWSPRDLAVLHGVMADKILRIISAWGEASDMARARPIDGELAEQRPATPSAPESGGQAG